MQGGWEQTYPTNNAGMHNIDISNGHPSWEGLNFGNSGTATPTATVTIDDGGGSTTVPTTEPTTEDGASGTEHYDADDRPR